MTITIKEADIPREFPPARLYLDDIEQIIRILVEAVEKRHPHWKGTDDKAETRVMFGVENQICDEVEDLPKIAIKTRDLSIWVEAKPLPEASLKFHRHSTSLSLTGNTRDQELGIHHKLAQVFKRRNRWLTTMVDAHSAAFAVLFYLMAFVTTGPLLFVVQKQRPPAIAVLFAFISTIICVTIVFVGLRHSTVVLRSSSERYALRQEMIWKSIPMIVSNILSFILGIVAAVLTRKYLH